MTEYQLYIKNLSEKMICYILVTLMVAIPIAHYIILATSNNGNLIQNSIYFCSGLLAIILLLGVIQGGVNFHNKPILLIVTTLTAIALLSTFTSLNPSLSLWGDVGRYEGLIMMLSYYIIFLSAMAIQDKKRILKLVKIFMFIGVIHCVYGVCQKFDLLETIVIDKYGNSVSGVAGNPNFMGTYTVLLAGLSSTFFYFSKNLRDRIFYLITLGVFLITLILTNAMSALFGVTIMVIFFFVIIVITWRKYTNRKEKLSSFKFLLVASVVIIFALIGVISITGNQYLDQISEMMIDLKNLATGGEITVESGARRFLVWKESLSLVPNYFLFGSGIDTFGLAYHGVFPVREEYFNKAHNELIQIVITQGVPALILYLSLYFVVFKNFVKRLKENYKNKEGLEYDFLYIGLCIAVIGYIAQAMFNISTIDVAPFFWMLFGFLAGFGRKENEDDFYLK